MQKKIRKIFKKVGFMKYKEIYNRNIGIFSEKQQKLLKNATVFIAGVGGVGGIQAMTLARAGIGEIIIMDPGYFDPPDMNRQYGAFKSTLGKNKALVTSKFLKDAAPFTKITAYNHKLDEKTLRMHIKKCNLVIDAIDLSDFEYKALFAKTAKEEGKYNLSSPIPELGAILMIFDPNGMTFEEFTQNKSYPPITNLAKKQITKTKYVSKDLPFLSSKASCSIAASLSAGLLANEAALIICNKRKKKDLIIVPYITYIDLFNRSFKIFNPLSIPKKLQNSKT
jgi:molybdopterin/thiamine biosynthesis adenylyltransferase